MTPTPPSEACRICNYRQFSTILSGIKTRLGETYALRQCKNCSFISVDPLPHSKDLKQYYDQDYWQRDGRKINRWLTLLYKLRMGWVVRKIKKIVPPKGRILDWGAGDGAFLNLLEKAGFDCWGIDSYSFHLNDSRLISTTIEEASFESAFFDAITCLHVLEHIERPFSSLKKALGLLKLGGLLVVEVPNIDSFGFQIFKKRWYPLDIPVHLNHFNPTVMQRLLGAVGNMQIITVEHFSHRNSPSSLLLSLIPSLSPPRIRARYCGRYPLPLMVLYLILQVVTYPFALIASVLNRGEVIRMYARKIG